MGSDRFADAAAQPADGACADAAIEAGLATLARIAMEAGFVLQLGFASRAPELRGEARSLPVQVCERMHRVLGELDALGWYEQVRWLRLQMMPYTAAADDRQARRQVHASALSILSAALDDPAPEGGWPTAADWQALRLRLALADPGNSSVGSRLLAMTRLRSMYSALPARDAPQVQHAWVQVLLHWCDLQPAAAALARLDEADALCAALMAAGCERSSVQRTQIILLLRRALADPAQPHLASLAAAFERAAALHEITRDAADALLLATACLARAEHEHPAHAAALLQQSLDHALHASTVPAHLGDALQLRLAIQVAHERRHQGRVDSVHSETLCEQVQRVPGLALQSWHYIVQLHLAHGRVEQAAHACAEAATHGAQDAALLEAWSEAGRRWAAQNPQGDALQALRRNQRARQLALVAR